MEIYNDANMIVDLNGGMISIYTQYGVANHIKQGLEALLVDNGIDTGAFAGQQDVRLSAAPCDIRTYPSEFNGVVNFGPLGGLPEAVRDACVGLIFSRAGDMARQHDCAAEVAELIVTLEDAPEAVQAASTRAEVKRAIWESGQLTALEIAVPDAFEPQELFDVLSPKFSNLRIDRESMGQDTVLRLEIGVEREDFYKGLAQIRKLIGALGRLDVGFAHETLAEVDVEIRSSMPGQDGVALVAHHDVLGNTTHIDIAHLARPEMHQLMTRLERENIGAMLSEDQHGNLVVAIGEGLTANVQGALLDGGIFSQEDLRVAEQVALREASLDETRERLSEAGLGGGGLFR